MVRKLGTESSKWNLNEWFAELNVELDALVGENGREFFRAFRWKWTAKNAHDPHEPNPDLGIPGNGSEMEEFISERRFMRADEQTEAGYIQPGSKTLVRIV